MPLLLSLCSVLSVLLTWLKMAVVAVTLHALHKTQERKAQTQHFTLNLQIALSAFKTSLPSTFPTILSLANST